MAMFTRTISANIEQSLDSMYNEVSTSTACTPVSGCAFAESRRFEWMWMCIVTTSVSIVRVRQGTADERLPPALPLTCRRVA